MTEASLVTSDPYSEICNANQFTYSHQYEIVDLPCHHVKDLLDSWLDGKLTPSALTSYFHIAYLLVQVSYDSDKNVHDGGNCAHDPDASTVSTGH